jgi:stage IV sporulation protein FB
MIAVWQEPEPTPFDLNWRMFGVPIRVHPFFWLTAAFLRWHAVSEAGRGIPYLLIWIACVFLSVLVHEFGHILAGRAFGANGRILLYAFGGLAIGSSNLRSRWQRIAVYVAGPLIQLVLAAISFVMLRYLLRGDPRELNPRLRETVAMLYTINLFWALFNLLPIFPLDGGQITREVCEGIAPGRGTIFAMGTSMVVSGGIAIIILLSVLEFIPEFFLTDMFNAILFALFAANSFQALQLERARRHWDDDRLPWER